MSSFEVDARPAVAIADELLAEWELVVDGSLQQGWASSVTPVVTGGGQAAVLKVIDHTEDPATAEREATFLERAAGDRIVRLIRSDVSRRALLLERLRPGNDLMKFSAADDEAAVGVFVDLAVATTLEPLPSDFFSTVADELADFTARVQQTAFVDRLVADALSAFESLVAASEPLRLVHGDLHHKNVLDAGNRWVAIDPYPQLAPLEYACTAFMRNPTSQLAEIQDLRAFLGRRLEQLSGALEVDMEKLRAWSFARAGFSVATFELRQGKRHEVWRRVLETLR